MPHVRCLGLLLAALICSFCLWTSPGRTSAGGGPENVFLVANSRSFASVTIARHYAELRKIPAVNMLYIDWPYSTDMIDVNVFREKLLGPIYGAMQSHGVMDQIDYIVYSSDFPVAINFLGEFGGEKPDIRTYPIGSLTSMTFYSTQVIRKSYGFISPIGNGYMRQLRSNLLPAESQGFRSWYGFSNDGKLIEGGGQSYVLSAMLGVTSNRGLGVTETVDYLRRAAQADGTKPAGTIYFCRTGDEHRSGLREPQFPAAIAALKKLDVRAAVVAGKVPAGKSDVAGVLTGNRNFDWKSSGSTILPGALCENFTSFGAKFTPEDDPQTPLTEFLRYGAAGSCGTVTEPVAIAEKFPTAFAQVHYARGCNLAESIYQSVACPYQLLLVGDPLCAPWASPPHITVEGVRPGATLKGTVSIRPSVTGEDSSVDRFELYVDGVFNTRCAPSGTLEFKSTKMADGYAELCIVGISSDRIETQGRVTVPVKIDNRKHKVTFTCSAKNTATPGTPIKLTAEAPDALRIEFTERMRLVGKVDGSKGEIEVDPATLSYGPVVLRARAVLPEDDAVMSTPIKLTVEPGPLLPGQPLKKGVKLVPGMKFTINGESTSQDVPATNDGEWLKKTKIRSGQTFSLESIFEVPKDDMYQFQIRHVGPLTLKVDKRTFYSVKNQETPLWQYIPVPLGRGPHLLQIQAAGTQPAGMSIRFGGPGAIDLDGKQFKRMPLPSK